MAEVPSSISPNVDLSGLDRMWEDEGLERERDGEGQEGGEAGMTGEGERLPFNASEHRRLNNRQGSQSRECPLCGSLPPFMVLRNDFSSFPYTPSLCPIVPSSPRISTYRRSPESP
jgi:hypothetical protein